VIDVERIAKAAVVGTVKIVTDVLSDLSMVLSFTVREILAEVFVDLVVAVTVRKGIASVVLINERAQDERKIG
jgi:hypothetical protein